MIHDEHVGCDMYGIYILNVQYELDVHVGCDMYDIYILNVQYELEVLAGCDMYGIYILKVIIHIVNCKRFFHQILDVF